MKAASPKWTRFSLGEVLPTKTYFSDPKNELNSIEWNGLVRLLSTERDGINNNRGAKPPGGPVPMVCPSSVLDTVQYVFVGINQRTTQHR